MPRVKNSPYSFLGRTRRARDAELVVDHPAPPLGALPGDDGNLLRPVFVNQAQQVVFQVTGEDLQRILTQPGLFGLRGPTSAGLGSVSSVTSLLTPASSEGDLSPNPRTCWGLGWPSLWWLGWFCDLLLSWSPPEVSAWGPTFVVFWLRIFWELYLGLAPWQCGCPVAPFIPPGWWLLPLQYPQVNPWGGGLPRCPSHTVLLAHDFFCCTATHCSTLRGAFCRDARVPPLGPPTPPGGGPAWGGYPWGGSPFLGRGIFPGTPGGGPLAHFPGWDRGGVPRGGSPLVGWDGFCRRTFGPVMGCPFCAVGMWSRTRDQAG